MKTFGRSMVFVVFLAILTIGFYAETHAKTQLQMPLGGVRGSYYMIGAPTAKYVNDKSSMISVTPNTSGGGVENIRRVSRGEAQLGMATAMEMQKSWNGIAPFKKEMRSWRTIGIATKILINNTVSLQKSNIRKIEDAKGKVFAIGAPGSAAAASMRCSFTS